MPRRVRNASRSGCRGSSRGHDARSIRDLVRISHDLDEQWELLILDGFGCGFQFFHAGCSYRMSAKAASYVGKGWPLEGRPVHFAAEVIEFEVFGAVALIVEHQYHKRQVMPHCGIELDEPLHQAAITNIETCRCVRASGGGPDRGGGSETNGRSEEHTSELQS